MHWLKTQQYRLQAQQGKHSRRQLTSTHSRTVAHNKNVHLHETVLLALLETQDSEQVQDYISLSYED